MHILKTGRCHLGPFARLPVDPPFHLGYLALGIWYSLPGKIFNPFRPRLLPNTQYLIPSTQYPIPIPLHRSRQGQYVDTAGTAGKQDAGAFGHRGSGRIDVVNKQYMFRCQRRSTLKGERPAHVGLPLFSP